VAQALGVALGVVEGEACGEAESAASALAAALGPGEALAAALGWGEEVGEAEGLGKTLALPLGDAQPPQQSSVPQEKVCVTLSRQQYAPVTRSRQEKSALQLPR
jgi:hypothetical protein